jgi:hypothetical protein
MNQILKPNWRRDEIPPEQKWPRKNDDAIGVAIVLVGIVITVVAIMAVALILVEEF